MNGRKLGIAAMFGSAILFGCGGAEVVVQAAMEAEDGTPNPLTGLEVFALPYDRDSIFQELAAAYGEPEPQIPDSLLQLQQQIADANTQYQQQTARWNTARDSLKTLSDRLQQLSPASAEYRVLFRDYGPVEAAAVQAERQMNQAFSQLESLQNRFTSQAEEVEARRNAWADQAYAKVDSVIESRLDEFGLEEAVDTTSANGIAQFELKPGQWWIHARYDLPYEELYWNERIDVARGEPIQVVLNKASASSRPKF
jgi:hypothetical protein